MATEKMTLVIPAKNFDPAPIPFGVVTGEGVDNYDGDGKEYTVSIILNKKEKAAVLESVLEYWNKHKPDGQGPEPKNFANIVRDGKEKGEYILYAKTQTHFGDKHNVVPITTPKGGSLVKLDPEEFGNMAAGTMGRIAVKIGIYTNGKGPKMTAGVSVFLSAVLLTKHVPYTGSAGDAFGGMDADESAIEVDGAEFAEDAPKKKKKKKKKKSKE